MVALPQVLSRPSVSCLVALFARMPPMPAKAPLANTQIVATADDPSARIRLLTPSKWTLSIHASRPRTRYFVMKNVRSARPFRKQLCAFTGAKCVEITLLLSQSPAATNDRHSLMQQIRKTSQREFSRLSQGVRTTKITVECLSNNRSKKFSS